MCRNANANANASNEKQGEEKNQNEREKPVAAEMGALFLAEMFLLFVIIYFCFTLMCVCRCVFIMWKNDKISDPTIYS